MAGWKHTWYGPDERRRNKTKRYNYGLDIREVVKSQQPSNADLPALVQLETEEFGGYNQK